MIVAGAQLTVTGIVLGLIGAGLAAPAVRTLLFDLRGLDTLTFLGGAR